MADAAQSRKALKAEYVRLRSAGVSAQEAAARVRGGVVTAAAPHVAAPAQPGPSMAESAGRGAIQGATLGYGDELLGAFGAKALDESQGIPQQDALANYRAIRDANRSANDAAREANPKTYLAGQIAGGVATAPVTPAASTVKGAAALGGALGAAGGLGASSADLTKGEFAQAGKDTLKGAAVGTVAGVAGLGLAKAVGAAADGLKGLGQARLFKAAVGQNKRAFSQVNGKGLWDKATAYLDDLGIGVGDSTESIGEKLAARVDKIDGMRDGIVKALDAETPAAISPVDIAVKVEKEIADPLKKMAAGQGQYKQALGAVDDILNIGENMTFAEAAAQRAKYQQLANYDRQGRVPASEEINRKIAQIWNDVIDAKAAPILEKLGENSGAYRELRQEQALAMEMLGHVNSRIAGNAANRVLSPSDQGVAGVGIIAGHPIAGIAGAVANHLGRVYGNAAAGRAALNIAKMAAGSERAMQALVPSAGRAVLDQQIEDELKRQPAAVGGIRGGI